MRVRSTKAHGFAPPSSGVAWLALGVSVASVAFGCRDAPSRPLEQAPCERAGIVSSRVSQRPDLGEVAAEIVQTCADCRASVRPGAPPGSPCSAASVCQEQCCNCANSLVKTYRARVCAAARCAGSEACTLARTAITPDVCD